MSVESVSAGNILSRGFSVAFSNKGIFFLINLLISSPTIIWTYYTISSGQQRGDSLLEMTQSLGYIGIVSILLSYVSAAAITYGAFRSLRGEPTSLGECLSKGLSNFLGALGIIVLMVLMFFGIGIVLGILGVVSPLLMILGGLGAVIVLIPVILSFYVAIPAMVAERLGPIEALKRSRELTDQYKLSIAGAVVLFVLINFAVSKAVEVVFVKTPSSLDELPSFMDGLGTYMIVNSVISALVSTISSVMTAVAYHDLRIVKEGLDEERLAALFD